MKYKSALVVVRGIHWAFRVQSLGKASSTPTSVSRRRVVYILPKNKTARGRCVVGGCEGGLGGGGGSFRRPRRAGTTLVHFLLLL